MHRKEKIRMAYRSVGNTSESYDGMMTYRSWPGRLASRLIWNLDEEKGKKYISMALSGIPANFQGRLLEVPVGTGCLSLPFYLNFPNAQFVCLDYVDTMLESARKRASSLQLENIAFLQGDVGQLPFDDSAFDIVLSLHGLHVFPDKDAAFREIFRVLRPGGIFCGTCYVTGERMRTDFFVRNFFVRGGFFTPPFETASSLRSRLEPLCYEVKLATVESQAAFVCRKR